jgi:hypothetical protein
MSYLLIWDTGDSVFETQKEALSYAQKLKKRGRKLDRLQVYRYMGKKYKTKPKIIKKWK